MSDPIHTFAADFPPAEAAQWRQLVDKVLKGTDFDRRLVARTGDGIAIQPLYSRAQAAPVHHAARGAARADGAWDSRQIIVEEAPASANEAILDDLAGGVTSIHLQIAAPGWCGLDYTEPALSRALDGVMLDVCPIALTAGEYTTDAAGSILALWRRAGLAPAKCHGAFNYDPLGTLALTGALYQPLDKAMAIAADLVRMTLPYANVRALVTDGHLWHRGGASEALELACVMATVVAYVRAAEIAGVAPADALAKIAVTVAIDADQFLGIAKIRAARICLAQIAVACGAASIGSAFHVTGVTSARMMTTRDPWVNMLRTTMACSAAAMGGADTITVLPFTWAMGRTDAFARRVARNTHLVLQEESGLGRVQDPAGGSWYVEQLTGDLAAKAWAAFQDIERQGGLDAMLMAGSLQHQLAAQAKARAADVARGKIELTGTSAFPRLGNDGVKVEPWPLAVLSADLPGARITPMQTVRLSEPFERLRDAAERAPKKPRVFLATLGPLAAHAPRAMWMRNFLAAGGIEAVGEAPLLTSVDAGRAFSESGCTVVCLVGDDDTYGELGEATVSLLKTAGAGRVYLAGRPKTESALRAAGVDDVIFAGSDRIATLMQLLADLGVKTS